MKQGIIGYDELEARHREAVALYDRIRRTQVKRRVSSTAYAELESLKDRIVELKSHMALQERNEEVRIRNNRLIEIIVAVKKAAGVRCK